MGGDDHLLDLVDALVDGGDLGVPAGPLRLYALHEAGTAVPLGGREYPWGTAYPAFGWPHREIHSADPA